MSRAYDLYLEYIEAHDSSYPSSLAVEVLQAQNPDLSCRECYPAVTYHRSYRRFWPNYRDTYTATRYTQKIVNAHFDLSVARSYNTARAASRDIVFSCRYANPYLDPADIIAALLQQYTQYTLAPNLPLDFEGNIFDHYIENPNTTTPSSYNRIVSTLDTYSTVVFEPDQSEALTFEVSPPIRSIHSLAPENLDPLPNTSTTSSLSPYDEDTTYTEFPPRQPFPSSPPSAISLEQPPLQQSSPTSSTTCINYFSRLFQSRNSPRPVTSATVPTSNPTEPIITGAYL
jgi:hypothetical protein